MIDPAFKQQHVPMDHERCKYPSKICRNVRTRKRNGELHRFCAEHHNKANKNQKRWSKSRQGPWNAAAQHFANDFEPVVFEERVADQTTELDDSGYSGEFDQDLDALEVGTDPSCWQDSDDLCEFLGDLLYSTHTTDEVTPSLQLPYVYQQHQQPTTVWPLMW